MVDLVCLDCWERTLYITFLAAVCISSTNVCGLNVSRRLFFDWVWGDWLSPHATTVWSWTPGGQNWSETAETTAIWCIDLGGKMGSESATDEWRRGFALGWAATLGFLSQCSFSAEQQGRETQKGGERETREREENGLNDNESEERKGRGDVEWLLEIGDGGAEEMVKRKRIDPDGILEIHIVTSPSTESCELDGGENHLCVTWSQQTFVTTSDCQICSANLESLQRRAQLQKKSHSGVTLGCRARYLVIKHTTFIRLHVLLMIVSKPSQRQMSSNQTTTILKPGLTVFPAFFRRFRFLCEPRVQPGCSFGVVTARDGRDEMKNGVVW